MAGWDVGASLPPVERRLTQYQIASYARASGDHNPLHLDPEFAAATPFGGIIAHGMLTLAFISEMLTQAFGPRWLETGRLRVRFRGAAYPGEVLGTSGEVTKVGPSSGGGSLECSVRLTNGKGEELITGTAHVAP